MDARLYLLLVALGALPLIGVGAAYSHVLGRGLAQIEGSNAQLIREIEQLELIVAGTAEAEAAAVELERRVAVMAALAEDRTLAGDVLAMIEASTPPSAQLTRLSWDDSGLRIVGRGAPSVAADLMDGLQTFGCVREVSLTGAGSGRFDVRFELVPEEPCPPGGGVHRDLFANPLPSAVGEGDVRVPAVVRWPVRDYEVLAATPAGEAILQDPSGGSHLVAIGSVVGSERARVTVVTDDQVILSQDIVTNAELGKLESRLITLSAAP